MTVGRRIGMREVRALGEGQEVWDVALPGFGARRQRSSPPISFGPEWLTVRPVV